MRLLPLLLPAILLQAPGALSHPDESSQGIGKSSERAPQVKTRDNPTAVANYNLKKDKPPTYTDHLWFEWGEISEEEKIRLAHVREEPDYHFKTERHVLCRVHYGYYGKYWRVVLPNDHKWSQDECGRALNRSMPFEITKWTCHRFNEYDTADITFRTQDVVWLIDVERVITFASRGYYQQPCEWADPTKTDPGYVIKKWKGGWSVKKLKQ